MQVSALLFDPKADASTLQGLSQATLTEVGNEIPSPQLRASLLTEGISIVDFLVEAGILSSKSEAKKAVQGNAVTVNKVKISDLNHSVSQADLLHHQFIMIENGKKNKFLVVLHQDGEPTSLVNS
jgi:tyrosyl-tRNA synthetase